jgi:hypothetical protein
MALASFPSLVSVAHPLVQLVVAEGTSEIDGCAALHVAILAAHRFVNLLHEIKVRQPVANERDRVERKALLDLILAGAAGAIRYSDHFVGDGPRFRAAACQARAEGVVSKRMDAVYSPRDRGLWRKSKCLNREEFVIVGWTDPEGSRPYLGALLLGYYTDDGKLVYAGRAGGGMSVAVLKKLHTTLAPLAISKMPLQRRHRKPTASGRRSNSAGFIGCARNSSRR